MGLTSALSGLLLLGVGSMVVLSCYNAILLSRLRRENAAALRHLLSMVEQLDTQVKDHFQSRAFPRAAKFCPDCGKEAKADDLLCVYCHAALPH